MLECGRCPDAQRKSHDDDAEAIQRTLPEWMADSEFPRALLASPRAARVKALRFPSARTPSMFICVLTGDKMFSQTAPREFVDDVAYSVRGSIDAGLDALLLESPMPPPGGSSLPIEAVDLVSWAGLRPTPLDRAGFMQRWQRYVAALQTHLQNQPDGERRAERLGKSGLL